MSVPNPPPGEAANAILQNLNHHLTTAAERQRDLLAKSIRSFQENAIRFIDARLERDRAMIETCRDAKDLASFVSAHNAWVAHLAKDYYEGNLKVAEAMRKLMLDAYAFGTQPQKGASDGTKS